MLDKIPDQKELPEKILENNPEIRWIVAWNTARALRMGLRSGILNGKIKLINDGNFDIWQAGVVGVSAAIGAWTPWAGLGDLRGYSWVVFTNLMTGEQFSADYYFNVVAVENTVDQILCITRVIV